MKKLTVSIFTLFFVLFNSVFVANAETVDLANKKIGDVKAKGYAYYYDSPNGTEPTIVLQKGSAQYVYRDKNASAHPNVLAIGGGWVFKKDGTYKELAVPDGDRIGIFTASDVTYVYNTPNIVPPIGKLNDGTPYPMYNYKNKMFGIGGGMWVSAKDVEFTYVTSDKETPVTTTTIGKIASLEGEIPIYDAPSKTAKVLNETLKQDDFATTLEVKGKQNGFYNVGGNRWIEDIPENVRFLPNGTETDLYKFIYDVRKWEGSSYEPYKYGETGTFDETGLIFRTFRQVGYTTNKLYADGFELVTKKVSKPRIGDLIIFKPDANGERKIGIIVSEKQGTPKYITATPQDGVKTYTFDVNDANIAKFGRIHN